MLCKISSGRAETEARYFIYFDKSMNSEYIISLDLGGTKLLGILVNRSAEIVVRQQYPSPKGNEAVRDSIIDLLSNIMASAEALKICPTGIAICAPGFVDTQSGSMIEAENLQVENLSLTPPVADRFHLPTCLFHDVRSATLAEALFGAGVGRRDFIFLNIGTGVAVGLFLGGKVYHGAAGKAGEIGHIALKPVGAGNPCGLEERLEMLVSGPALVHRATVELADNPKSQILKLADQYPERVTTQIIQEAALRKDALAVRLIEETADYLGVVIGGMLDLLNPECIIFGGGIAQMGDLLLKPVERSVARYAIESVPLVLSTLGGDVGALGAAAYYFGLGE
jgi:glucokinase